MTPNMAGDFTAAGGMPNMDSVRQIQSLDKFGQVVGVGVQIIAVPGLAGTAMATTVMRDAAVTPRGQIKHLVFKGIRAQRPAMTENDRLTGAPVLEVDVRSVFGGDGAHNFIAWLG
jgi:hypothetical protein